MAVGICPFATFIPGVTRFSPGHLDRVGFCDHTAAGFMGTLKRPDFWNDAGVSAHFAISKTGEIVQLVNIFDTAFAQGRLGPTVTWPSYQQAGGGNPNAYLISTEHEDETEVNMVWPEAMYDADLRVKRWCIEECNSRGMDVMRFGIDSLAGHHMFDGVNRANCPGSGWPRDRLFADLTGAPAPAPAVAATSPAPAPTATTPPPPPPPVPPALHAEVYHQHDAWGLNGLLIPGGGRARINVRQQFGVPAEARRIAIEWLPKSGYGIVLHGNNGTQAGRFGWSQKPEFVDGYDHTPNVVLDAAGNFEVFAEDSNSQIELFAAHVTAWW